MLMNHSVQIRPFIWFVLTKHSVYERSSTVESDTFVASDIFYDLFFHHVPFLASKLGVAKLPNNQSEF